MGILNRLLIICLFAASLPAQRSPFFATVTGPDNKPLANAVVTCVSSHNVLTPWPTDTVVTRTDARGRARCSLLTGRVYVAWGVADQAKDGKHWVTAIARLIASGRVVTLQALESQGVRTVKLRGLNSWRSAGANSVHWYPDRGIDLSIDLGLPAQELVTVPASPWTDGVLAVTDAQGVMVCTGLSAGANEPATLRQPKAVTVKVVDDRGKPVANAKLSSQVTDLGGNRMLLGAFSNYVTRLRLLGSSDSSGHLSFFTPELLEHVEPWGTIHDTLLLFADAKGMQQAAAGSQQTDERTILMTPRPPLEVVIQGSAAADAKLIAAGPFTARTSSSVPVSGFRLTPTTSKPDSRWLVHGIGTSISPHIKLANKRPTAVLSNRIEAPKSPTIIDLDTRTKATISVTQKDVGPAACVLLIGRTVARFPLRWEVRIATDSSGHADLLMEDGSYVVYAISGTSHGLAIVDAAESQSVAIELTPLETMSVRVLDDRGKPVVGARARGDSTTMTDSVNGEDLNSHWALLSAMMVWHFVEPCRSDQDGRMKLPVFLKPGCEAEAKVWIAGFESEPFRLQPGTKLNVIIQ